MKSIEKLSKARLKQISKLKQKKYRDHERLFLISGSNAVESSLQAKNIALEAVICSETFINKIEKLNIPHNIPVYSLSENDFNRMGEEQAPQGIALLVKKPDYNLKESPPSENLLLYLERINDPGNLGTIMRTALWFGINTILLSPDSVDPFHPKVQRAAAGCAPHLRIYEQISADEALNFSGLRGYDLAGTAARGGRSLTALNTIKGRKTIFAFGSEGHGLSPELQRHCSDLYTISRPGSGESLNLAVSVGLFLYQLSK